MGEKEKGRREGEMECVGRGIFSVKKVGVEDDENDAQSQKVCKG